MNEAWSDARNATTAATSSGSPQRAMGTRSFSVIKALLAASVGAKDVVMGVLMYQGRPRSLECYRSHI
jgi:hypothetical protein